MHTPSDGDWIREARNREVYQASEARWSIEGVIVASPQPSRQWLNTIKAIITRLKPSQTASTSMHVTRSSYMSRE
jgi:hypothetical protein